MNSVDLKITPTLAFERRWLLTVAPFLIVGGITAVCWSVLRPHLMGTAREPITAGRLRPPLIVVPTKSGSLAIAEREISQSELIRGLQKMPRESIARDAEPGHCPAPLRLTAPASCVSMRDIAGYSNALTERENTLRGRQLTPCFGTFAPFTFKRACTGFRPPTIAEWQEQFGSRTSGAATDPTYPHAAATGKEIVIDPANGSLFYIGPSRPERVRARDAIAHFRVVRSYN